MMTIHAAAAAMRNEGITPRKLLEQCLAQVDVEERVRAWVSEQLTNANPYRLIWSLNPGSTILKGQYEALIYIREHTPPEAVIMTQEDLFRGHITFAVSESVGESLSGEIDLYRRAARSHS